MFRRVSAWIGEARTRLDFIWFERAQRREHLAAADEKFPIEGLESEITGLRASSRDIASSKFGPKIEAARDRRAAIATQIFDRHLDLNLLGRDLDAELRSLKAHLNSKHERLGRLKRERHNAEQDKRMAAREISDWHHSTKDWLGNRKPVPRSSFFGRSWSELDGLKDDMEDCVESVLGVSEQIGSINGDILELERQRAKIFKAKDRKRDLLGRGVSALSLQRAIAILESDGKVADATIGRFEIELARLIDELEEKGGLSGKVAQLEELVRTRQEFIDAFEESEARSARRASHRDSRGKGS